MNVANFKKVLDYIEAHPEEWDQGLCHCGATHCFLGHAQILSGNKPSSLNVVKDAMQWLNITEEEFNYLFCSERTLADFRDFLAKNGGEEK